MWLFLGIMQFSFVLLIDAGGGGGRGLHFRCLTSQCWHDDVCRLNNTNGHLNGQCLSKHAIPHYADHDGCPQILGDGYECFCNIHNCGPHTQAATGHPTITTTNHNDLMCGYHVCHGHQYCIVEEKDFNHLHLKCADVHNTQHCLPNLLSLGSSCFCDTRTCVDHTLISIFAGHQVAGLICSDFDDHSCHADKVCEIQMDKHGHKMKHCGDGNNMTQCTQLPKLGQKCYCTTQKCIFGQYHAPTTISSTYKSTTTRPIVAASTTLQHTTVHLTTGQRKTATATTTDMSAITSVSASTTVPLANPPTIPATTSIPTNAELKATNNTCTDDEDVHFSCVVYDMMYGLCNATSGTLFNIAQKRCQAFCGICSASLPTQPSCIDHDARCSQVQFHQICSSAVSKNFVISTCPKSCNKCAEYLASLNPTTATAQPVTKIAKPITTTAKPTTTTAKPVTTTAKPITTTTAKPVTTTAKPVTTTAKLVTTTTKPVTITAKPVTTTYVVCQDKPGVDCKLFNIDFCANPYSNTICAKSCGHCTRVIQSAFG